MKKKQSKRPLLLMLNCIWLMLLIANAAPFDIISAVCFGWVACILSLWGMAYVDEKIKEEE